MKGKNGKKYVLIGEIGMFGPETYFADSIKKFPLFELEGVSRGDAVMFKAEGDAIYRIRRNGTKY